MTKVFDSETAQLLIEGLAISACTKCGESSWVKAQPSMQTKKIGFLTVRCKVCTNKHSIALYATNEEVREAQKAYHKDRRVTDEEWHEAEKARGLAWQKENPGKANANTAKRRAKKLQATPAWSDLTAIQEFYMNCPPGMHVDHIIPLQGRKVSGLHVPTNLQYLTATENLSKSNTFKESVYE